MKYLILFFFYVHLSLINAQEASLMRNTNSPSFNDFDSSFLNKPVNRIMKRTNLKKEDLYIINEPAGICRGFEIELKDSSFIYLFIDRTVSFRNQNLYESKIIGIGIIPFQKDKSFYGTGKPLNIDLKNKYEN